MAFITPAHAGTVLSLAPFPTGKLGSTANLNLSGAGNPAGSSGYIVASGYDNLFPSTTVAPPKFSGASTANLDVTTDKGGVNKGLGLNSNDAPYVGPTDAIVLDLSNVKATLGGAKINQVTFDLYKDITGGSTWVVYGTTSRWRQRNRHSDRVRQNVSYRAVGCQHQLDLHLLRHWPHWRLRPRYRERPDQL